MSKGYSGLGGKGGGSGISAGNNTRRELTRKEQWIQSNGLKQSSPQNVKVGDSIATRIIKDDQTVKYEKWASPGLGDRSEVRFGKVEVKEVKKTAKTTKITAETPNGRVVTRTFKNSEDVFVFKKKKRNL